MILLIILPSYQTKILIYLLFSSSYLLLSLNQTDPKTNQHIRGRGRKNKHGKKKEETSSSSSNVPPEIIQIILSKLPAKSLLRFRTVSKSWNTMISDPLFVDNHLRNSPNNLFVGRYRDSIEGGFSFVKLEGKKFHAQAVLDSPNRFINILCECNGVLLLTMKYLLRDNNYLLWNPSTRRERYLVCPYDEEGYSGIPGICYDPIMDNFKVVLIGRNNYTMYSSKNNSWTRKRGFRNHVIGDTGTFFDGSIYWVLWFNASTVKLFYFDPKTDELKRLDNPELLSDLHYSRFLCLRGSLCLFGKIRDENDVIKHRIWIREKGNVGENPNWKEFITFEDVPTPIDILKLICFVENKILVHLGDWRYAYYSPSEKKFEEFEDKCCDEFVQYWNTVCMGLI